ncbi:Cytochrome P450 [Arabidopsis thaliana x Arabidopsis arenosa]|uniref:Cytochrome P450 n=1 Tax=Arabidopsis thaliana x Arabidopsis arenosa TaxID=1240361 RepID=A0A8T2F4T1_9BRAS|nr:Cytochrome P450 [Arabidopsis thaliana x Arabidopsis arenosa]
MVNILILSLLFLIIFLLLTAFKRAKRRQHRPIPSPPGFPIIGNLHQLGELPHQSLWKLSKKYGPVMLLNLGKVPTVILSSSETAKQALRDYDLHCCSRPSLAGGRELSYNNRDISFSPYNDYWKELRKLCTQELFSAILFTQHNTLRTKRIAFGVCFEGTVLSNDSFNKLIREAFEMLGSFSASDFIPYIGWIIDRFTGLQGRREKSVRDLDAFYEQIIDLHKEEKEVGSEDFVDLLLKLEKEETVVGNNNFTRNKGKAILMEILLAGIETSEGTMAWAMAELAKNPRVMRKVQSEIRNKFGNRELISFEDIEQLHYLKLVIKETWRLHPPAPLLLPREVMSEFEINGYTMQPKTQIHVNVWAIGRDPNTWKDPEEFLPERFIDSNIDTKGQNFELLPFGGGRRMCPAMYMGTTMVEFGLANLLYHFDWKLPEGMKVDDMDMEEAPGLTVNKKNDLLLVPVKYLDN